MNIPGLKLIPEYITRLEEEILTTTVNGRVWSTEIGRSVQHYGYKYHYLDRAIDQSMRCEDMPKTLDAVAMELFLGGYFHKKPDQAIVNKYEPGHGIGRHIDCPPCFGEVVASLSMNSHILMDFWHPQNGSFSLHLPPRSLLVLEGDARNKWYHGIAKRNGDIINNVPTPRGTRISITYRTVKL